ncbi:MAG TPA: 16S rRNA (cytidine(1402)-2'-O)-methyltransferase [Gaiellaceae bacterium]|nr:16S rRNA (cytidine(1402)-2'-O)-methyltransferase [Gaiellaceae bacterium]
MSGTLYLVGTPIGHLDDLSERARRTLAGVDLVAAEDTRRSGRLLAHAGIRTRIVSLFEGNERRRTGELLEVLRAGRDVAVISDAGMPGLSDPGYRLVRACVEEGIDVRVVPGPSAAISALVGSGLPADRFVFEGFLPRRAGERRARLRALEREPRTIVLFESPRRLRALLREVVAELGDRRVAVARELTKLHEEFVRGRASEVLARFEEREPRGEIVVVVAGAEAPRAPDLEALVEEARALAASGRRLREAATEVGRRAGVPVNELYRRLVGGSRPASN